jgi:Tfp pilus assembly protein PilN
MITQFTINLNKGEDTAEREVRWRKRREVITMTVLILAVLVVGYMNYIQNQVSQQIISTKMKTKADITRQLDSLKKSGKNISKEDVLALAKLEKERVLWSKKFLSIGELLPDEMAVTYLEYKNNTLLMRFITTINKDEKEFDKVKGLIDILRASPLFFRDFADIRLKEQHQTDIEEQTILSFSVLASIDRGMEGREKRTKGGNLAKAMGGGN